jgi:integrase
VILFATLGLRWFELAAVPLTNVDVTSRRLLVDRVAVGRTRREVRIFGVNTATGKTHAAARTVVIPEIAVLSVERLVQLADTGRTRPTKSHHMSPVEPIRPDIATGDRTRGEADLLDAWRSDYLAWFKQARWNRLVNGQRGGFLNYIVWKRALDTGRVTSGVDYTAHALRHVAASVLIASGADEFLVAKQIGHTNPAFIRRVYAHLFEKSRDDLKNALDAEYASLWVEADAS